MTGPSGSGKTTFLNVAGLLESFDTGSYMLDGQDVSRLSDDQRSRLRNEKIGFIFQGFNLIPDLNIFDNVDVPLRYRRLAKKERDERIKSALDVVGLVLAHEAHALAALRRPAAARRHRPRARRRPAVPARGRADRQPRLADGAPGLDLLEQINEMGTTIIMVTHDPELARRAHRNVHIVDGQISDFKPYETRDALVKPSPPPAMSPRLTGDAHVRLLPRARLRATSKRNPGLTALMICAIALGIAVCVMTLTMYHAMSGNPIWWKNDQLYAVTMDIWDPQRAVLGQRSPELPPPQLTYRDATAVYASDIPARKVIMYKAVGIALGRTASR